VRAETAGAIGEKVIRTDWLGSPYGGEPNHER
jgi:hypothetical protein